jgi:hypothetical protein
MHRAGLPRADELVHRVNATCLRERSILHVCRPVAARLHRAALWDLAPATIHTSTTGSCSREPNRLSDRKSLTTKSAIVHEGKHTVPEFPFSVKGHPIGICHLSNRSPPTNTQSSSGGGQPTAGSSYLTKFKSGKNCTLDAHRLNDRC